MLFWQDTSVGIENCFDGCLWQQIKNIDDFQIILEDKPIALSGNNINAMLYNAKTLSMLLQYINPISYNAETIDLLYT